jgi:hypothetical protein
VVRVELKAIRPTHVYATAAAAFLLIAGLEGARMAAGHDPALAAKPTATPTFADPGMDDPGGSGGFADPGMGGRGDPRSDDGGGPPDDGGGFAAPDQQSAPPLETHQS